MQAQPRPLTLPSDSVKKISVSGQVGRELSWHSVQATCSSRAKPPTTLPQGEQGSALAAALFVPNIGVWGPRLLKQSCMTVGCLSETSHIVRAHLMGKATKAESQPPPSSVEPSPGHLRVTQGGHCELCSTLEIS